MRIALGFGLMSIIILSLAPFSALAECNPYQQVSTVQVTWRYTNPFNRTVACLNLPDGSGDSLDYVLNSDGYRVDASFEARLLYSNGQPAANCTSHGVSWWYDEFSQYNNQYFCVTPWLNPTDSQGYVDINGPFQAGGYTSSPYYNYLWLKLHDTNTDLEYPEYKFMMISPDLNGDGYINVTDVGLFAGQYYSGTYNGHFDFHYDQSLDIADLNILAASMGHNCPGYE